MWMCLKPALSLEVEPVKHAAQFALLGVTVLAAVVIAIVSKLPEEPIYACERGHLQAAMLVHLARACLATRNCDDETLRNLLERLYSVNKSYNLLLFEVTNLSTSALRSSYGGTAHLVNVTSFEIKTPAGSSKVEVRVEVRATRRHAYVKTVSGVVRSMVNFSLVYTHRYTTPFFNVTLCPLIYPGAEKIVDIRQEGPCRWVIGVPERVELRDEFGIAIRIPP